MESDERQRAEERLRTLLDALPAAVYTTDAQGRITMFNQAAVELSGRVPELGTDSWCVSWKLYWPDGTPLPHDQCPMAMALKEGRPVRGYEAVAERPDGTRVHFVPYPTPLRDSAGKLVGAINMLVDVTERKQEEEAKARLAAIVESSDDAIVSKNLGGIITSWNRGAEGMFGYTAEEAIGQSVTMLIPPDRYDEEPHILGRVSRGEKVEHYETVRRRKDGTLINISLSVSPIVDANGKIVGASKIARDITVRRQAEQERNALMNKLEEERRRLKEYGSLLTEKIQELENFHELVIGRELKLEAAEKEIRRLKQELDTLSADDRKMQGIEALDENAGVELIQGKRRVI